MAQKDSCSTGIKKPIKIGMLQNVVAIIAFRPVSLTGTNCLLDVKVWVNLIFFLEYFSITKKKRKKRNNKAASCFAVVRSFIPNHVLKIPVVKVGMAKCSTAPKSEIVSIATTISPAIIAGLANGNPSFKKVSFFDNPSVLPVSKISLD